ncbi:flowering time control protein FPA [Senna tora]|uniref:Flowering time control protein FPA n=1 Tax=Senna tora TaxID=362788 RepID=A0A834TLB3_9FABA|nr:flowering time control protein FPA [Senna tora]
MPLPTKSIKAPQEVGGTVKDFDDPETPSNNLWVGNLSFEVTESDLMALFAQYGALDSVTSYSSRSYGFVFFKRIEDAKAAKNALQGTVLRGIPIKIEFARPVRSDLCALLGRISFNSSFSEFLGLLYEFNGSIGQKSLRAVYFWAKPCKHLWVGGISPAVTKEELEVEFRKFGKIEDFKFLRDRNTAFVEYFNLDDAIQAMKVMNGKSIGGDQIRVDFLRSQSSKKMVMTHGCIYEVVLIRLTKGCWLNIMQSGMVFLVFTNYPYLIEFLDMSCISSIVIILDLYAVNRVLLDMLLDYGQFQGKSMGPTDSYSGQKRPLQTHPSVGRKGDGQPSNVLWIGYPPSLQIDEQMLHNAMILFGEIERIKSFPSRHYSFVEFRSVDEARRAKEGLQGRLFNDPRITIMYSSSDLAPGKDYPGFYPGMVPNNFPGQLAPGVIIGPNVSLRPFGPQGNLEPLISGSEFNDLGTNQKFQDGSSKSQIGPNWKRPSPPAPGMLPSPAPGIRPPARSTSGAWDVLDINQFQRDSKRSRIDGALPIDDAPFPLRNVDDRGLGLEQSYGMEPIDGGSSPFVNIQGKTHLGPVGTRITAGVPAPVQPDIDHIWRGIIAKGGTPVCQARCVPIGKGIGSELPEVVDCSARTGLDMLTKHYADAIGFDIVFFLPDSEDDFASYTEFLRYLGAKNRAGVAKFVDGTTLFLVPPSEFLTKVLKVTGPERLYGVVLKFSSGSGGTPMQQSFPLPITSTQFVDRPQVAPSQVEYGLIPAKEEQVLPVDYNRMLHEESKLPAKQLYPAAGGPPLVQSVPPDYTSSNTAAATQPGVSLTPELIATLALFFLELRKHPPLWC